MRLAVRRYAVCREPVWPRLSGRERQRNALAAAGSYTFTMQAQSGGVTGSVTVPEQTSVTAVLDRTDWLKADGFMLSSASKTEFDGSKLPVEKKTARELTAVLDDSFTGTLYAFWPV